VRLQGTLVRDETMAPEGSDDWRWKARRALSRFGPRAIPALVEALSVGDDPTIRRFAADSLALLGVDARSASEALRHAAWHDADPSVREAAAAALDAVEEPRPPR
jgi:HEAT repeat protein